MVTTQHYCAACGSEHIRRNGSAAGHAKYQCKACGHQARFVPAAVARAVRYAQVDKLLLERNSQRSIVRVTGVSRTTVAGRIKKALLASPPLPRLRSKKARKKRWEALELDEMWTFVGRKQRKVWRWLAVERASRRVVAWVTGRRGHGPAVVGRAAPALPPPLPVFYRRVESLRGRLAPLAAPALPQGRRPDHHRGGHQLFAPPTRRCAGSQVLFVQQVARHAQGPN